MKEKIPKIITILTLVIASIYLNKVNAQAVSSINNQNKDMKNFISIFEIPATDLARAIKFYESILDLQIEKYEFPEMQMGLFPTDEQVNVGVIMKGDSYVPSSEGVTIYLNAGDDLQFVLDKVEKNGGRLIVPKTPHADEIGYFALFIDSEGNKIGLHSPN